MRNLKWKIAGIIYFCALFVLTPATASAYIDPSITSYAIQAIAGIVIASGAFFAAYGRRAKRKVVSALGLDETNAKPKEKEVEVLDPDLKEELETRRNAAQERIQPGKKSKHTKRNIILSLICGGAFGMTLLLRPIISFYLSNESEFWFSFSSVLPFVLLVFLAATLVTALVHFLLPDKQKVSLRLLFATAVAAGSLCVFVQNHFLSSYLPVLTGDPIDWSLYSNWNIYSIVLWAGVFLSMLLLVLVRPRIMKVITYSLLFILLCTEIINGTVDIATARHENKKGDAYFSENGLFETSEKGNIVVLVSDTFEGTYMNRILEEYPEYRDILSDCTYYDNVTGLSVFTYFSYAKLLSGLDYPNGTFSEEGVSWCLDNETTLTRVRDNGWDIGYYTTFSPTASIQEKVINYSDKPLIPTVSNAWHLTKLLIKSTLFRSVPHPLKPKFLVYTNSYESRKLYTVKNDNGIYVEDDEYLYKQFTSSKLKPVSNSPRYSLIQLYGIHEPSQLDENFRKTKYDSSVPIDVRKIQAGRAQLLFLRTYLDKLKEAGTYDQTTVIMTADHGFNMRYYPVMIVKEAKKEADAETENVTQLKIDHTPISLQEDYENLIASLSSGNSFTEAIHTLKEDRTRHAVEYRSTGGYSARIYRRSIVDINGEAKNPESYRIDHDEFFMEDDYSGRCILNAPFLTNGNPNYTVAVYGIENRAVTGHTVLFDAFFDSVEKRELIFKASVTNKTNRTQRLECSINGNKTGETISLAPSPESQEIIIRLPEQTGSRISLEIDLPDAVLLSMSREVLAWNDYQSVFFNEAGFYDALQ